jgi:type IV pilus assembly protein PilE
MQPKTAEGSRVAQDPRRPARQTGFSLIELLIVMAIIAILAAIAYPTYLSYTERSNRTDATASMTNAAQILQRCYSQTYDYTQCLIGATPPGVNGVSAAYTSSQGFYNITVVTPMTNEYTITATPAVSPQTEDTQCTQFTVNQAGQQSSLPSGTSQPCWGSN